MDVDAAVVAAAAVVEEEEDKDENDGSSPPSSSRFCALARLTVTHCIAFCTSEKLIAFHLATSASSSVSRSAGRSTANRLMRPLASSRPRPVESNCLNTSLALMSCVCGAVGSPSGSRVSARKRLPGFVPHKKHRADVSFSHESSYTCPPSTVSIRRR